MLDKKQIQEFNPQTHVTVPDAIGSPCKKHAKIHQETSTKSGWGGPRANSGGPRPNSGGPRPGSGRKRKIIRPEPIDLENHWYCVQTEAGQDRTADIETRIAGFEVFAPTIWKPPIPTTKDRHGIIRPSQPARVEPLFRGYFFTRFCRADLKWTQIIHLPGVNKILSSQGRPTAVPDNIIETLRSQLSPNGCDYGLQTSERPTSIQTGATVRLTEGPMIDLTGICQMSDGKRVRILLEIMGHAVAVTMAQEQVEVVTR